MVEKKPKPPRIKKGKAAAVSAGTTTAIPSTPPDGATLSSLAALLSPPALTPPPISSWAYALSHARQIATGFDSDAEAAAADPEYTRIQSLRELCRGGNPFPLIAAQWPEFVITDPAEAKHFDGEINSELNPCLRLDFWQRDIIRSFFADDIVEIFIKGCVGAGKGTSSSLIFNLAFDVWNCRIILTSATFEHAVDTLFAEVTMWRDKMKHRGPGRTLAERIYHTKQHQIMVSNPMTGEGFSGKHGEMIIYGFDEASAARQLLYDNAQNQFHKLVALSNPRTTFGWFRSGFKPCLDPDTTQTVSGPFGKRRCVTVSGADCANVRFHRLEKPIAPIGGFSIGDQHFAEGERIPADLYQQVKPLIPNQSDLSRYRGLLRHPDKREVDVKAHGKFPTEDAQKQVILGSWLDRHEQAWLAMQNESRLPLVEVFSLDVARSLDGDETVLTAGGKAGIRAFHKWKYADTTLHATETLRIAAEVYGIDLTARRNPICVDMDGLGAGVGDQLRQKGVWVIEFRGNATSGVDPRRYANLRAEAYGTLARRLDPNDQWAAEAFAFPIDEDLRAGLTAPEKIYSDGLRFHISPKNRQPGMSDKVITVKEKLEGRSPDTADSCVYCFHAVREFYALNEWFAMYSGPLVTSAAGAPLADSGLTKEEKARQREAMTKETRELLDYLHKMDGGAGTVAGGKNGNGQKNGSNNGHSNGHHANGNGQQNGSHANGNGHHPPAEEDSPPSTPASRAAAEMDATPDNGYLPPMEEKYLGDETTRSRLMRQYGGDDW